MPDVLVTDCSTGEQARRPETAAEVANRAEAAVEAEETREAEEAWTARRSDREQRMATLTTKARAVLAGQGSFTAAERDRLLAALVLDRLDGS